MLGLLWWTESKLLFKDNIHWHYILTASEVVFELCLIGGIGVLMYAL
jgi:hypothetical protein